ncbi:MAG: hypothetical protein IJF35_02455 [Clostridia bacterium]|nr:hypothetical protein [Oscillospiraceae bacterium]MBQ2746558.1 hypothetical protein [Clostridia bacterium]
MLTVKEIYNDTVTLLAINDYGESFSSSNGFEKDFLCCLNKVILDLSDKASNIKSLRENINLPISAKQALCNGTAMWLALILGDSTKQNFFVKSYNSMRTRYKSTTDKVVDKMPR